MPPYHYDTMVCYLRTAYSVVPCVQEGSGAPCVEDPEYSRIRGYAVTVIVVYAVAVPLVLLLLGD